MQRQHVASTKPKPPTESSTHHVSTHLLDTKTLNHTKNQISMDMTGRYPITSKRRNKYILVMVDWDSNYMKLIPLKTRKSEA